MKIVFIYCPRSGDRVFATGAGNNIGIGVAEHPNGCRHVACTHVISAQAAEMGRWFRAPARELVSRVVSRFGGIGWDECGTVCYAAPTTGAALAAAYGLAATAHAAGAGEEAARLMFHAWMMQQGRAAWDGPSRPEAAPELLQTVWGGNEEPLPQWTIEKDDSCSWVQFSSDQERETFHQPTCWQKDLA